ncbi:hypothetical protein SODALDRAFT_276917 [Sodiomyces alkalinus F11]|uniref:Transcription factor domain-containing protein n=1 Tax=Sodiomyces alkalinus (strain CBS 110278 / VKM F-3762 / F11) TaxID=1314773 RepID=A0A3N2PVB3_SODAK|nr:hypothetical protein SODALDRAFT_276917 [Sodiomyces alkalinus F11]ROT38418.1 hypothetical protein SODALDRAFT_276917 [Sodiomyces alkalinus F11]
MSSSTKSVKFVASGPSGLPVKRKQVQQACEACRKRKKRCIHTDGQQQQQQQQQQQSLDEDGDDLKSPSSNLSSRARDGRPPRRNLPDRSPVRQHGMPTAYPSGRFVCDTNPEGMFTEAVGNTTPTPTPTYQERRFVCDTNPEGMFAEATGPPQDPAASSRNDEVGVWVPSRPHRGPSPPSPSSSSSSSSFSSSGSKTQAPNAPAPRPSIPFDPILLPYVREHCLPCVPPDKDFRQLKKVYSRKIHPIYALVPDSVLGEDDSENSPAHTVLRQVISLAASTDPSMANHLRLKNKGPAKLPLADFTNALSGAIRTTLATSLIPDRTVHIRVLCMLSLYFQPSSADESEVPSQFFAEAVHHCQTLGLHLLRTGDPALETLFCAVWALDKINAAANGRPRLLYEWDFAASVDECIGRQEPCFRLFLMVSRWLDRTIDLYRPAVSADALGENKPFVELPVLEPLIVEANALEVPTFLVATIEVFYHAVIILSCRLPRPGAGSKYASNIPPPMANARRSLASERIASNVKREKLSPVPFVPYAVSLSLSVEYRKMRHSALPMFRSRAVEAFKANCELLKRYKGVFWNARVTYGLGERLLKEMERAATSLAQEAAQDAATQQQQQQQQQGYDVAVNGLPNLDAMNFNLDVFGHFDPSFDLTMADNALEGNLDIGLPLNWGDWEQTGAATG